MATLPVAPPYGTYADDCGSIEAVIMAAGGVKLQLGKAASPSPVGTTRR
ncbi:hypothetical protein IMPERIA75_420027 [Imperialibacter sp. 75]|nr:hypothetical protein IMPERIA75_420027 [Imperialibacter sp. 75]